MVNAASASSGINAGWVVGVGCGDCLAHCCVPATVVLLENDVHLRSADLSIEITADDPRLGKFRGKTDQFIRLYLPFCAGILRPLKMACEKADQSAVYAERSLGDWHLIAHEVLRRAHDGPFRKDHNPFRATGILRYVIAVPREPSFLLHQTGNK